jgi:DNA-binding response OmpR family regulator
VLIVHPDGRSLGHLTGLLEAAGYGVIAAHGFSEGRAALGLAPSAVVTALQLGEFNGLHLVVAGRAGDPALAAVVIDAAYDAGREVDTVCVDAAYIVDPIRPGAVLALLSTLLARKPPDPLAGPLGVMYRERRGRERRVSPIANYIPERRQQERRQTLSS